MKPDLWTLLETLPATGPNAARIFSAGDTIVWLALDDWSAIDAMGGMDVLGPRVLEVLREGRWSELVSLLNLDFSLATFSRRSNRLLLIRGPASRIPLYIRPDAPLPALSTKLWSQSAWGRISQPFLRQFLAVAYLPAPIECDHALATAAEDWLRTPRATVLEWLDGAVRTIARLQLPLLPQLANADEAELEDALREAVDKRITGLAAGAAVSSDLSGGIDSGIIAARARRLLGDRYRGGVSLLTPYPELRREKEFIDATTRHGNITTALLDVEKYLPFAELASAPIHDEPSLGSIPWALLSASLTVARTLGADVHLHGIGGDQVFLPPPARFSALSSIADGLSFMRWPTRLAVRMQRGEVRRRYFGSGSSYIEQGLLLYDGWVDRYVAPYAGVRHEGIYVDFSILRICQALRARKPVPADLPKMLPRRVFAADLPPEVRARRGKAGFDGVYQRGLRTHYEAVGALVDAEAALLQRCGVKPGQLLAGLKQCARKGWGSRSTPLFAALAWATWSHGLRREGLLKG